MKYKIVYENRCVKYLKKLGKNTQIRILKAINELPSGDVKKLKGTTDDYRLRIGQFRVVFNKDKEMLIINVLHIDTRGDVYNK
ncbi:MAG: type II toxin-antitoxin system RelE/ParE family toxin [Clostridiales bacterium]|nr:type II toxin-antitoxin system RelE/ParE family toxin [Clostridiales bacterium]